MKRDTYTQVEVCAGKDFCESAQIFNEKMQELKGKIKSYEREGNVFLIYYTLDVITPEGIADEKELQGIHHKCRECEHFKLPTNRFGEPDGRIKKIFCERAGMLARPEENVCDIFYEEHQDVKDFAPAGISKIIAQNGTKTEIEVGA